MQVIWLYDEQEAVLLAIITIVRILYILPFRLKYRLEFLPERANWDGSSPSSSMMWAM